MLAPLLIHSKNLSLERLTGLQISFLDSFEQCAGRTLWYAGCCFVASRASTP